MKTLTPLILGIFNQYRQEMGFYFINELSIHFLAKSPDIIWSTIFWQIIPFSVQHFRKYANKVFSWFVIRLSFGPVEIGGRLVAWLPHPAIQQKEISQPNPEVFLSRWIVDCQEQLHRHLLIFIFDFSKHPTSLLTELSVYIYIYVLKLMFFK
jgi:hypothetical protein